MRSICHQLGHIMQSYCHTNKYSPVNDVPMLSRSVIDRIKIYFKLFYIPPYSISSHPLHVKIPYICMFINNITFTHHTE